jgi:outer membrane protein assembly factor BamD
MYSPNPLFRNPLLSVAGLAVSVNLLCGFGLFHHHKKYETAITKDTLQPDKVLYDKAVKNIEKGQYLTARITLNTLINTYDTSEYLAKAKLAIADSWFREGDAHGLAQAEIEYKDFILFYPNMEEAAESQSKICDIHIKQMLQPDRDNAEGQRAEDECRAVITQFPNSKFAQPAEQKLRNVQEILADKEYRTAEFYYSRGAMPAAEGRYAYLTQQYPLFSAVDDALWKQADTFRQMGDRFENQEADALVKIVRDYPASYHLAEAKARLTELKHPIPESDPAAYERMKYNIEHRKEAGFLGKVGHVLTGRPEMGNAAKQGSPAMTAVRPPVPLSVPADVNSALTPGAPGSGGASGVSDVGIGVASNTSVIDQRDDARLSNSPVSGEHKASANSAGISTNPPAAAQPLPTNRTKKELEEYRKRAEAQAKAQQKAAAEAAKKAKKNPPKTPETPGKPASTDAPAAAQQ